MKEYERKILKVFLWLPIIMPLVMIGIYAVLDKIHFGNSNSFFESIKAPVYFILTFTIGSAFLGGVQYVLFLLGYFCLLKRNTEVFFKEIYVIPLYFSIFYFFVTFPVGLVIKKFNSQEILFVKDIKEILYFSIIPFIFSCIYIFLYKLTCFIYGKFFYKEAQAKE